MGEIYKMLYFGHKDIGEIYPFLGEQTERKMELYGWSLQDYAHLINVWLLNFVWNK